MGDALHVSGGVTDAKEARLAQGGLIAVQGPTVLDARTGVLIGPGSTTLITGTAATGPMTVAIGPHVAVTTRGAANGPYLGPTLEASTTVNIAAAPASGSRIDVVYAKQQDSTSGIPSPDVTTAPLYGVVTGTSGTTPTKPSIPVGAVELATVTVAAGATATNGAGVTIANTAQQVVARGAEIPVFSQAQRDALTAYPGLRVLRMDAGGRVETYPTSGSTWLYGPQGELGRVELTTGTTGGIFNNAAFVDARLNLTITLPSRRSVLLNYNGFLARAAAGADSQFQLGYRSGGSTVLATRFTDMPGAVGYRQITHHVPLRLNAGTYTLGISFQSTTAGVTFDQIANTTDLIHTFVAYDQGPA